MKIIIHTTVAFLIVLLVIGSAILDYRAELNGKNDEGAEFCRNLGYFVQNEVHFFFDMTCVKFEKGIKTVYLVKTSATKIGEVYSKEYKYYLIEPRK